MIFFNFFDKRASIFSKWFWRDLQYDTSCIFFPRNKWANKVIPRQYSDKPELIKDFLFASVIDYVEGEKALEGWTEEEIANMPEHQRNCHLEISAIYPLVKDLPRLQEENLNKYLPTPKVDGLAAWFNCPIRHEKMKPVLAESDRLEKLEQELCERIVKVRESLWT